MTSLLRLALQDLLHVLQRMPNVALAAFALVLGMNVLALVLHHAVFLTIVMNLLGWLLLTLYFVAIHRFVILGEVAPHYPFAFERRNRRFFVAGLLLSLLSVVPMLIGIPLIIAFRYAGLLSTVSWLLVVGAFALIFAFTVFLTRLTVLLPAIAVDAPGAGWANAYRDTKGYTFRIFMAYLVGLVLVMLAALVVFVVVWGVATTIGIAMSSASAAATLARVGTYVVMAAFSVLYMTFFVAIASRAFETVADRLKAPRQAFQA